MKKYELGINQLSDECFEHGSKIDQLIEHGIKWNEIKQDCFRVYGIEREDDETAGDCLEKGRSIIKKDLEVNIHETSFDRGRRIIGCHKW